MPGRVRIPGAVAAFLLLIEALFPATALAHEQRLVAGKYQFEVGFLNEPSIAGQMNGIDLTVTTAADSKPVEGLDQTLKAEVIVGGGAHTMPVDLVAREGQPGAYDGYFIPTREGSYTFHFTGTVGGTSIDERFESGPGRFDDVQTAESLQFPDKLPDTLAAVNQANAARDEAASARTFGIAGLVVGVVGLIVGGVALVTRRRPEGASASR